MHEQQIGLLDAQQISGRGGGGFIVPKLFLEARRRLFDAIDNALRQGIASDVIERDVHGADRGFLRRRKIEIGRNSRSGRGPVDGCCFQPTLRRRLPKRLAVFGGGTLR